MCKGERRDGKPCGMWVNVRECEYCDYHVMAALKKTERQTAPKAPVIGQKTVVVGVPAMASTMPRHAAAVGPQSEQDSIAAAKKLLTAKGYTLTAPDPNSSRQDFSSRVGARQPLGGVASSSALSSRVQTVQGATPHPMSKRESGLISARDSRTMWGGAPSFPGQVSSSTVQQGSKSRTVLPQRNAQLAPAPRSTVGIHALGAPGSGRVETKTAFESKFGKVDVSSTEAARVFGARAIHEASAREEELDRVDKSLKVLAKKDELNEKVRRRPRTQIVALRNAVLRDIRCLTSLLLPHAACPNEPAAPPRQVQQTTSRDVTATKCETCGYLAMKARDECVQQCHVMKKLPTKQRWFECRKCRNHIMLLNQRLPEAACEKCHDTSWRPAGMRRSSGSSDPGRGFLARGVEHGKFLSSDGPRPGIGNNN